MTCVRLTALALLLAAALVGTARAGGDDTVILTRPEARAELSRGLAAHAAGDYETAIAAFRTAYALEPHPDLLFAQAQAERLSGDCSSALALYREYLASDPPERQAIAARRGIDRCERALSTRPPQAEPDPPPAPPVPEITAPAPAPGRRQVSPWYTDIAGGVLVGTGTAALVTGSILTWQAVGARDDAGDSERYSDFIDQLERADRRRWIGLSLAGAGAALVAGGAIRYVVVADRADSEPSHVRLAPLVDGASIGVVVSGPLPE